MEEMMTSYDLEPQSEIQLREWFAAHLDEFGYRIIVSQRGFPDWLLTDGEGHQKSAEAEYTSKGFLDHKHDASLCDMVICWLHDIELPIPVLELSTGILHKPDEKVDTKRLSQSKHTIEPGTLEKFKEAQILLGLENDPEAVDQILVHYAKVYGFLALERDSFGRRIVKEMAHSIADTLTEQEEN